ncbi:hypothetical protein MKW98_020380 [Papaver atlanticum]|uniref:Uncharacterized protein n=1 Tax=Papaver atlanticum TaxID=357466 RepID=A0AAD4RVJ9_9MAGN|nr:hypothetical protein MKW98_020380 [Papaver atlanticum]
MKPCLRQMEVGIEDCQHIEFEYSKSKYHFKDLIIGKIYFLLGRINSWDPCEVRVALELDHEPMNLIFYGRSC